LADDGNDSTGGARISAHRAFAGGDRHRSRRTTALHFVE